MAFSRLRSICTTQNVTKRMKRCITLTTTKVTPEARQILDQLTQEIDDRRRLLADRLPKEHSEEPALFSGDPFFAKLHRHDDLRTIDAQGPETALGDFHKPLELITRSAFDVYQLIGKGLEGLPYQSDEVKHEVFERLLSVRDFIIQHAAQEIKLDKLAALAYMSRYHFLRLFKQAFRITPHQFQLQCRLEHACALLRDTDLPAIEISFLVGFESHTSFAALFKRRFGLTPLAYRFRPDADSQF